MIKFATPLCVVALGLLASSASAKPAVHVWPELGVDASIAFPNYGAIRNFEADGNDGIWIEDQKRRWYYGEIMGSCQGLNFAHVVGFDAGGSSRFDKFSRIIVDGDTCQLQSFVTSENPRAIKARQRFLETGSGDTSTDRNGRPPEGERAGQASDE